MSERPQYGLPLDCVPIKPNGRAICMSEAVLTFQPQAPRPPSQWVISPEQPEPAPSHGPPVDLPWFWTGEGAGAAADEGAAGAGADGATGAAGAGAWGAGAGLADGAKLPGE